MTESVYINAARDKVVEPGPEAAYRIHRKDAQRLGLLKDKPKSTATSTETETRPARRSTK